MTVKSPEDDEVAQEPPESFDVSGVPDALANDLFRILRGRSNLLFAGSRAKVETYTDRLSAMCREERLPNEFFAHHGNLAKAVREEVEIRLRDDPRPTTAVATMTLELGIDIGDVATVAQIGPGFSVASLRQRLGRSGRRAGKPAILRIFAPEISAGPGSHPIDRLYLDLVQSIAMVECLREDWCEPPADAGLHLSTLIHQVLALILQTGGLNPLVAWELLCNRGPFRGVGKAVFADVLRCMAAPACQLVEQSQQGTLMLGATGEKIAESYEFYAVFMSEVEYRIVHEAWTLGTYPIDAPVAPNETLIFAGRRWRIVSVDDDARVITVKPTRAGKPPYFTSSGGGIHDHIVEKMREILAGNEDYFYLDEVAVQLLGDARTAFRNLGLHERSLLPSGDNVLIFPWVGTKRLKTLLLALLARQMNGTNAWHAIEILAAESNSVRRHLEDIAADQNPDAMRLADHLARPQLAKFDYVLSPELINLVTIRERLDVAALPSIAAKVLTQ